MKSIELQVTGGIGILNPLVLFQTVCCGYSLESSPQGDAIEYPQQRVQYTVLDVLYFEILTPFYLELWADTLNVNETVMKLWATLNRLYIDWYVYIM